MAAARIELDDRDVGRSAVSGVVMAGIWLHVDGLNFPAKDWEDAAVAILAAWAKTALRLLHDESTREEVHFMEGPYSIEIAPLPPHSWHLALVERRQRIRRVRSATVDPRPLVDSIIEASDHLLVSCRRLGWETQDSKLLTEAVEQLRLRTYG
jgi:hypothetical protein